jgi:hypothetical protein
MKNVNTDFLLDIWADLKAKRLAPVAIGLALALVAMPALMLKGGDAPSASPLPMVAAPAASGGEAQVELADELAEGGSKLDSYKAHDPFSGAIKPGGDNSGVSGTATAPSDATAADAGGDLAAIIGAGSPSGPPDSVPGLGSPDYGGGLTTGGDTPPAVTRPRRTSFTYELDVKFGQTGHEKRYRHLSRMSVLPNAKTPALMFMGIPVDAKSAIFFVHPALSHAGEGTCMPSQTECTFLELTVGRDHFLSVKDYEFHLHLYGIKKVKLDDAATGTRRTTGSRRSGRDAGEGVLGGDAKYDMPALIDGIG